MIIKKPWGQEEVLEINQKYMLKRLTMLKGHRCSLQYHKKKKESIYVLSGLLQISMGPSKESLKTNIYKPNEYLTIPPGVIHRMEGVEDSIYLESSTPEMDDVIRVSDDYNRKNDK